MNVETHSQLANFIWSICNLLRGPYKRNEYRKVILPLTVLRRFDCLLAPTKPQVLKEHAAIKAKPESVVRSLLEKITGRPFYNLAKLDFTKLLDDTNQLAPNLNAYINGFSKNVRDIMDRFAFDQQITRMGEKNLLYEVIKAFSRVDLSPDRVDNVQMGYVFEELIRIGAEQANEEAGEHFTPREVIRLMVNLLLSPEEDLRRSHVVKTIYDPACGTGGMLSVSEAYIRKLNKNAKPLLFGQDWNDEAWAVCKSDMLIKGEDADNIRRDDTFTKDGFDRDAKGKKIQFDYMLANPPLVWSGNNRPVSSRRKPIRLATTGASVQGYRASTTAHCCFCSTCCQRCARPRKAAAGLASSSMVRRYSPATPAVARATFASGSSRTIGWRLSSRCRTSFSTTPASPPTSGCSPIARSSGAKARCT
jgi:type I restriction enzyme M protein